MVKFHLRVKRTSHAPRPTNGSSSNNPKSTKYRSSARMQRLSNINPHFAVDEKVRGENSETNLLKLLPLAKMTLGAQQRECNNANDKEKATNLMKLQQNSTDDLDELLLNNEISKNEYQLWSILPVDMTKSIDFQSTIPILAPLLGAVLNERPALRLTALNSIRAAIKIDMENGFNLMQGYAKNLLPILFNLYTNAEEESTFTKMDPKAVRQSALSTIHLYMQLVPKQLLKQYISVALQKLASFDWTKGEMLDKNLLLSDILVVMCSSATADQFQTIFDSILPWFGNTNGRLQKKAYRILAQIYQRINEQELKEFFISNRSFLMQLVKKGSANLDKSVFQWRIAIYRNMVDSFNQFDPLFQFCDSILEEIIAFMDTKNSKPTRHQAANCLVEISQELLRLWTAEGMAHTNPLDFLFTKLFCIIKFAVLEDEETTRRLKCALIALNILCQKQLSHMNSALVSQLITHSTDLLKSTESQCRALTIRLVRTICARMQPLIFEQFKEMILTAIFLQPVKDSTVCIRKSNALLLNLLMDRMGIEMMLKFADHHKLVWRKILKNLEKIRKRRQRRKKAASARIGSKTTQLFESLPLQNSGQPDETVDLFRTNKEGKLLIMDLDEKRTKKRKQLEDKKGEGESIAEKVGRKSRKINNK